MSEQAEPLEVKSYLQPGSQGVKITLKRWDTQCGRFMNGRSQEGVLSTSRDLLLKAMDEWERFEKKIGSKLL